MPLARIVARCLEKTRETRFQSARDLAFGLDVLYGYKRDCGTGGRRGDVAKLARCVGVRRRRAEPHERRGGWLIRSTSPAFETPLANAQFTRFTDWEGTEGGAANLARREVRGLRRRQGRSVRHLAEPGGHRGFSQSHEWEFPGLRPAFSTFWQLGFSGDGANIWFSPATGPSMAQMIMPLLGGTPRGFLDKGATAPSWSPDGTRLTYFKNSDGDPLFVADRTGADARQILVQKGMHHHNPVWSPDGQWIYFARGLDPTDEMDVWRVRPSGGPPERLTEGGTAVNFLAPLDTRTLLYVARAEDRSGPWLWALDVERKVTRRVNSGLGQYMSVSASRDGRRMVATVANPTASLWRVPLLDRQAEDRDVQPYPLPTARALAPRFGGTSLFYLSAGGTGDALWRVQDGQASEVQKGADGALSEPPAVSPDGSRVAIVVRREGKRHLSIMSADGTKLHERWPRPLNPRRGRPGHRGLVAGWRLDRDGRPRRAGARVVQSPGGWRCARAARHRSGRQSCLVAGRQSDCVCRQVRLPDRSSSSGCDRMAPRVEMPPVRARPGGYRFLPNGTGLVYLPFIPSLDFWLFDFATKSPPSAHAPRQSGRFRDLRHHP